MSNDVIALNFSTELGPTGCSTGRSTVFGILMEFHFMCFGRLDF